MPLKPGCWIFFSALTLRLVWIFLIYRGEPVADQLFYLQSAQNLATENRYLMDGFPTAYWPVGYSFFLSLFFKFSNYFSSDSLLVFIQCSQAILSSLSALLIYLIAKKRMSFSFAALAGLLYAFYPAAIAMAASFWSETLFVFFLLIAFYFSTRFDPQNKPTVPSDIQSMYAKISLGILSGLAIGLAAYVRPTALLYLPFLSLNKTLWDFKYQFKVILVRGMVAMLLLLPWALRNHQLLGHWVPVSTNFGPNLYIGHNPEMNGGYMNSSTMDSIQVSGGNEAEQSQKLSRLAIQYALHHPLDEIKWLVIKITRLLSIQRTPLYYSFVKSEEPANIHFPLWAKLLAGFNNLGHLIIVIGWLIFTFKTKLRQQWASLSWIPLITIAFHALLFAEERFIFSVEAWLILSTCLLTSTVIKKFRYKQSERSHVKIDDSHR